MRLLNLFLEYGSLVYLRFSEPDSPRPWRVPLGVVGPILLGIPSAFMAAVSLYYSPLEVLITGSAASGIIIIGGGLFGLYLRYCSAQRVDQ